MARRTSTGSRSKECASIPLYRAQPICSPSRAAILTGKAPARLHSTTFVPGHPDCASQKVLHPEIQMQVPRTEKMLQKYFMEAGYATAAIGQWHVGGQGFGPLEHGFDVYHPRQANTKPPATEGGKGEYDLTAFAERFIETNKNRPFLVYLTHNAPHIPYAAQKPRTENNAKAFEPVYAGVIETVGSLGSPSRYFHAGNRPVLNRWRTRSNSGSD